MITVSDIPYLTPREADLFRLLLTAKPGKEIAHDMGLTHYSGKTYVNLLLRKLGLHSRIELMALEIVRLGNPHE